MSTIHAFIALQEMGQVFPQIFPFVENESAIGALPISMFMHPLVKRNERLASLMNHLYVRTMDQTILTAMEPQYMHFVFNIIKLIYRKGLLRLVFYGRFFWILDDCNHST